MSVISLPYQKLPLGPSAGPAELESQGARTDKRSMRYAVFVPSLMAVLLALVPLLRATAKYPMLLALVPLILWSSFVDTELALYVYIAYCWMDGTIRGVLGGGTATAIGRDVVLMIVMLGWAVRRLQNRGRDPFFTPPATLLIALFTINCLIQVFNPYSLGLMNTLSGLKSHLSAIPVYFIACDTIRRRGQVKSLFLFLTLACLVISLVAGIQYIHGKTWTYAHFPGSEKVILNSLRDAGISDAEADKVLFRPPGTTLIGGNTGVFDSLVMPLTFACVLLLGSLKFSKFTRFFTVGIFFVYVVTIFQGGMRIAVVHAIEGLVFCAFLTGGKLRSRALAAVMACLSLGMLGLIYSANASHGAVTGRFASLFSNPIETLHQDRKTFFEDFPSLALGAPFGVGLGRAGAAAGYFGASSGDLGFVAFSESYLGYIIIETGLPGAILISGIAITFLLTGFAALKRAKEADDRLMISALLAALLVICVDFFFMSVLSQPPGSVLFWLFGGVLARVFWVESSRNRSGVRQESGAGSKQTATKPKAPMTVISFPAIVRQTEA